MGPGKQGELQMKQVRIEKGKESEGNHLAEIIFLHKGKDEPDEAKDIQWERDQSVVADEEWEKIHLKICVQNASGLVW